MLLQKPRHAQDGIGAGFLVGAFERDRTVAGAILRQFAALEVRGIPDRSGG